ncbi:hypothetical protein XENOCAPTIV_021826 [Xenoophorus captivus]|uniref:Uncharacterized protein n=1 Tax=Xenoophorus captivus TaxID=1517983 RepID=A0ABV0QT10_9TELE
MVRRSVSLYKKEDSATIGNSSFPCLNEVGHCKFYTVHPNTHNVPHFSKTGCRIVLVISPTKFVTWLNKRRYIDKFPSGFHMTTYCCPKKSNVLLDVGMTPILTCLGRQNQLISHLSLHNLNTLILCTQLYAGDPRLQTV